MSLRETSPEDPLANITITDGAWLDVREGRASGGYGDGTCPPAHNRRVLRTILQRWINVAAEHNITWFLTYGSLIGAWRDGDLIPWDTDMDIHTFTKDNIKLDAIKSPRNFDTHSNDFHLAMDVDWRLLPVSKRRAVTCDGQLEGRDSCTFHGPVARLIKGYEQYMDMWDLEVVNGMVYERYAQGTWYSMEDIFPLKKCLYVGLEALCPRNPRVIFDMFYEKGGDMTSKKFCVNGKWLRKRIVRPGDDED